MLEVAFFILDFSIRKVVPIRRMDSQFLFPSIAMHLCMVVGPTVKSLYMYEISINPLHQAALDGRVLPLEL
jgi:hypothetical protein